MCICLAKSNCLIVVSRFRVIHFFLNSKLIAKHIEYSKREIYFWSLRALAGTWWCFHAPPLSVSMQSNNKKSFATLNQSIDFARFAFISAKSICLTDTRAHRFYTYIDFISLQIITICSAFSIHTQLFTSFVASLCQIFIVSKTDEVLQPKMWLIRREA